MFNEAEFAKLNLDYDAPESMREGEYVWDPSIAKLTTEQMWQCVMEGDRFHDPGEEPSTLEEFKVSWIELQLMTGISEERTRDLLHRDILDMQKPTCECCSDPEHRGVRPSFE